MRRRVLAVTGMLLASAAMAQTSTVSGSSGGVLSLSQVTNVNQSSLFSASSISANISQSGGAATGGVGGAIANANASSEGVTQTIVAGQGGGGAVAVAGQNGSASSIHNAVALDPSLNQVGSATAGSSATVGTFSNASLSGAGAAGSNSYGLATNESFGAAFQVGADTTVAVGATTGQSINTTFGAFTGPGTADAGGSLGGGVGAINSGGWVSGIALP
jgi:hypothetical protein